MSWKEDIAFVEFVQKFFELPEIKELVEKDNWSEIFTKAETEAVRLYFSGYLADFLNDSKIVFDTFLTEVPIYCFYGSKSIDAVDLRNTIYIGSRAFRMSSLKKISLTRKLESIGNALFSGCENDITIYWEGSSREWNDLCKDDTYLSAYRHNLTVQCNDKTLEVEYDPQNNNFIKRWH